MSSSHRRDFLGQVGLSAAALAVGAASSAAAGKDKAVLGIIGTGGMGTNHVRNLATRKDCSIAYVCDVDDKRLSAAGKIVEMASGQAPKAVKDMRKILTTRTSTRS